MRVFLNLLAAVAGGHLARSRGFIDRFQLAAPGAHLIVLKEGSTLTEYGNAPGRTVINIDIGHKFRALYRTAWENLNLAGMVRSQRADVYLTFSHYLPNLRPIRVPTVVGVSNMAPFSREAWEAEGPSVRLKLAILRRTIIQSAKRADRVLALSNLGRKQLVAHGVPEEKIRLTPNGVDPYWGVKLQAGFLLPDGVRRPFLLYVSHFHRYKNHLRLLEAFAALPMAVRDAHQLVFVGQPYNRDYYAEVGALAERLELASNVVMIPGMRGDRLKALYQNAAVMVFPSLIENSPAIPLEAMLAGAPVATGTLAPMPEICGEAAAYFDPLDTADMARGLEMLLKDDARIAELRRLAVGQAGQFTWEEFTRRVVAQLKDVAVV